MIIYVTCVLYSFYSLDWEINRQCSRIIMYIFRGKYMIRILWYTPKGHYMNSESPSKPPSVRTGYILFSLKIQRISMIFGVNEVYYRLKMLNKFLMLEYVFLWSKRFVWHPQKFIYSALVIWFIPSIYVIKANNYEYEWYSITKR